MPLGKYHCDYCDKEFQDTPSARKRHIQGLQHQRAKALWYESFNNPYRSNQAEFFGNGVCNHFVRTGFCQYGDSCRYFHPKQIVQNPNSRGLPVTTNFTEPVQSPVVLGNQLMQTGGSVPVDMIRDNMGVSLGNLPPSLRPPPEGGYHPLPFVDWG